jgi:hypothetical protein
MSPALKQQLEQRCLQPTFIEVAIEAANVRDDLHVALVWEDLGEEVDWEQVLSCAMWEVLWLPEATKHEIALAVLTKQQVDYV